MQEADMQNADAHGTDMSDADIHGTEMPKADMPETDMPGADKQRTDEPVAVLQIDAEASLSSPALRLLRSAPPSVAHRALEEEDQDFLRFCEQLSRDLMK